MHGFDKMRWRLSFEFKCPLSEIDSLCMNDFYGLFRTIKDMHEGPKGKTSIRRATKTEMNFVDNFIKQKGG